MKKVLLWTIACLFVASAARADHIAIYADEYGQVCNLNSGFSATATVLHKFSAGSTGSRFKMDLSLCPGTTFIDFITSFVTVGNLTSDLSIAYGVCSIGTIVLGTITADWAPGAVSIVAADSQTGVIVADCDLDQQMATGGHASIDGDGHGCDQDPVEPSTWGGVKALYR